MGRDQKQTKSLVYKIAFSHLAEKQLNSIPKADLKKIVNRIEKLKINPFPEGSEKLSEIEGCYRIRQGDYRIIYTVKNGELIILILKIGHRREVYR